MTKTIGVWCDMCRRKYVQHVARDEMPCKHGKEYIVEVEAKNYARSGESVWLRWYAGVMTSEGVLDLWVEKNPDKLAVGFYVRNTVTNQLHGEPIPMTEGRFIKWLPPMIRRAYLERWQSFNTVPDWVAADWYES